MVDRAAKSSRIVILLLIGAMFAAGAISMPTLTHNALDGLQGGLSGQYYHLTEANYTSVSNWDAAYEWGDHASLYLAVDHDACDVTSAKITNWDTAYDWGDHSAESYMEYNAFSGDVYTLDTAGITLTAGTLTADTFTDGTLSITGGEITAGASNFLNVKSGGTGIEIRAYEDATHYVTLTWSKTGDYGVVQSVGGELILISATGEITFGDDNLSTTGTLDAGVTTIESTTTPQLTIKYNDSNVGSIGITSAGNMDLKCDTDFKYIGTGGSGAASLWYDDTTLLARMGHSGVGGNCAFYNYIGSFQIRNVANDVLDFYTNNAFKMTITAAGNVGIGFNAPTGQLHIDQSSASGAKPVLRLDQADVDDSFIDFIGTSAGDATKSISTLTTSGATTHHIKCEVNGVSGWIAFSTNDPS